MNTINRTNEQKATALLPIQEVPVAGTANRATVFFDNGSNSSFITHRAAKRLNATKVGSLSLEVVSVGNQLAHYETCQYELNLLSERNESLPVRLYGMADITGPVAQPEEAVIQQLFPSLHMDSIKRGSEVDILLGNDFFGLHPKTEVAKAGSNLSIMQGVLGKCLAGTHPELSTFVIVGTVLEENQQVRVNFARAIHPEFQARCHAGLCKDLDHANFINGENLGIEINPKCGSCRCGKCPIVGHTFSFAEEQELELIRRNLRYDTENLHWVTKYPWIKDPNLLPNNYCSAVATLRRTEKTLLKDESWARVYHEQVCDMVERKVARLLTLKEIQHWNGPMFYLSHLAVVNPKSKTTPVRIVFNSSQMYHGVSLNSMLAKGPDAYLNSLLGILLRWRERRVSLIGDIRKMYNSIYIELEEQHCHRFLWRNMEIERTPDIYVITRVNMGDRPAGAISTEALYQTALLFQEEYPDVAVLLKRNSYVDDIVDSLDTKTEALKLAEDTNRVLNKAGFEVKHWHIGGEQLPRIDISQVAKSNTASHCKTIGVLGVNWEPDQDLITFTPSLNFSKKKRGQRIGDNLQASQIPGSLPLILTKRMVLEQTMKIYDPMGLLSPFTFVTKSNMRETWKRGLSWDEALPEDLHNKWVLFFRNMFELTDLSYQRALKPEKAIGLPSLILLSDASDAAYGFCDYIRWKLDDGSYWCRLVMAKCRIAPLSKLSTPQMELNAAVLAKRGRKVIETEMRFKFDKIHHLIDSETVLCMINKISTRFKLYEGVRIGEIQNATNGDMSSWRWIAGENNSADWVTRGRKPNELSCHSEWWRGPEFLYQDELLWPAKSYEERIGFSLPGEKKLSNVHNAIASKLYSYLDYTRFSSISKVIWTIARLLSVFIHKTFQGIQTSKVSVDTLKKAKIMIIQDVQSSMAEELAKAKHGRYARLNPVRNQDGLWVVGCRLSSSNPVTLKDLPQKLLPTNHPLTRLAMIEAHETGGHRGRDATLARFRWEYWTTHGARLAKAVCDNCQLCRLREPVVAKPEIGKLPIARLTQSPPFNKVMMDFFGPVRVRGEIQKRVSGKAYGIIFTDLYSRAVHIEAAFGCDTDSFMVAFMRFTSIRGWPEIMYSDPGTQLVNADKELRQMWRKMEKQVLYQVSASNGLQWIFGPADSP